MIRKGGRAFVAVATTAALVMLPACAQQTIQPPTFAEAKGTLSSLEQLRLDLRLLFNDRAVDHAQWSAAINSLKYGDSIYNLNAFRLQVPASNQKLLTAATAAEQLGWDFRYTTRVYATGPIAGDVLDGDLVVVSDGDPTINPRHPERWGVLDDWARALAARGLHIVSGQLVGDDRAFAEPGWGMGWSWDDMPFGFSAPVGALQYNENQVELMIGPGLEAGARAIISVSPPGSGLTIDHGVTTAAPGAETRVSIERIPSSTLLRVRGQVAADAAPVIETVAVPNPTLLYLNAFREALARHGIFVGGGVMDVGDLRLPPNVSAAAPVIEDRSPPLEEIISVMLKFSRNGYAETLLRTMARPETPATADTGLAVMRRTLRTWGIYPESVYLARDGSGLSRYDWVTSDALTWLLTYLWADPKHAVKFRDSLPVAGVSGSLADRLKNTPASGRVWAKTGSMSQVRSIAGYLVTGEDEPIVFSIIVNGFRLPPREIDAVMDKALVKLVEFKRLPVPP